MNDSMELHLRPKQLQALGAFAAQWSFFETEMDFTIGALEALVLKDPHMPYRFNERIKHWRKLVHKRYKTPDILSEATLITTMRKNYTKADVLYCMGVSTAHPQSVAGEFLSKHTAISPNGASRLVKSIPHFYLRGPSWCADWPGA